MRQPYRQPRPRGGFFSLMGHLIGLLGGGALGLVAGYYLLNWFGGPQFNVLEIPLPGIPNTQSAQQTAPDVRLQPAAGPRDKAAPLSPKREGPAATSTANSPRAGGPQQEARGTERREHVSRRRGSRPRLRGLALDATRLEGHLDGRVAPHREAGWIVAEKDDEIWAALQVDPHFADRYSLALKTDYYRIYRLGSAEREALLSGRRLE